MRRPMFLLAVGITVLVSKTGSGQEEEALQTCLTLDMNVQSARIQFDNIDLEIKSLREEIATIDAQNNSANNQVVDMSDYRRRLALHHRYQLLVSRPEYRQSNQDLRAAIAAYRTATITDASGKSATCNQLKYKARTAERLCAIPSNLSARICRKISGRENG